MLSSFAIAASLERFREMFCVFLPIQTKQNPYKTEEQKHSSQSHKYEKRKHKQMSSTRAIVMNRVYKNKWKRLKQQYRMYLPTLELITHAKRERKETHKQPLEKNNDEICLRNEMRVSVCELKGRTSRRYTKKYKK